MKKSKSIIFLFLGHFACDLYPGLLPPLLPIFSDRYGWSFTEAGILITVLQASCNISQPIIGIIYDHKPMKSLIWSGLIIAGLPFCFVMNINRFDIMIIAMVISGIGVGMFHPAAAVAAGRIANENRKGISMALFSSGGHVSFMIAPLVAVLIVEDLGDAYMPLVITPALIMALYFIFNRSFVVHEGHGFSLGEWFSSLFESGRELFILWIVSSFRAVVFVLLGSFLPMLAMARGASYAKAAYFLSITLFASMAGMFIGGHLSDIHGHRKIMTITLLVSTPLLYGFLYTSGIVSIIFLIMGMGTLSSTIPVNIILAQRANPKLAGVASSLVMGLSFAVGAFAATPFGVLADHIGIETAMKFPLILPVFGGITVLFLKRY